jgi:hypothetical protein
MEAILDKTYELCLVFQVSEQGNPMAMIAIDPNGRFTVMFSNKYSDRVVEWLREMVAKVKDLKENKQIVYDKLVTAAPMDNLLATSVLKSVGFVWIDDMWELKL